MPKLKTPLHFETAFSVYTADELIGEGGSGRVYGARGADGSVVAVKVLAEDRASRDKRSRFKNEIAFLSRNKHRNIVSVLDHGLLKSACVSGPFYVMPRHDCSLRSLIEEGIPADQVMSIFSQLLDGVEAAHLQNVIHRDLKPENVLVKRATKAVAVADFGIARFAEDLLLTIVQTKPVQRLANFQYAAPEQRVPGQAVTAAADLYALGLLLNEMYTGVVPHGTEYKTIASVSPAAGYLDRIVGQLLRQNPGERPGSVRDLKSLIQRHEAEAVTQQRLSALSDEVVPATTIEDPLAFTPPTIVGADWNGGTLTLTLDRQISREWITALQNMGNYSAVMGHGPETFSFQGNKVVHRVDAGSAQNVVDHFKRWLPVATNVLRQRLKADAQRAEERRREQLRRERAQEEERLRVIQTLKF